MTTKQAFTKIDLDHLATVTGASGGGDICRDAYSAVGGAVGGALTSESGGWGAVVGAVGGGWLGRKLCPK